VIAVADFEHNGCSYRLGGEGLHVARKPKNVTAKNSTGARLGFEEKLWAAADAHGVAMVFTSRRHFLP
jgi:hypothetical protein